MDPITTLELTNIDVFSDLALGCRRFAASPSGRCFKRESGGARASSAISTLLTLFPHMDEKVCHTLFLWFAVWKGCWEV